MARRAVKGGSEIIEALAEVNGEGQSTVLWIAERSEKQKPVFERV